MYQLKAGFARIDITPPIGYDMSGYFIERLSNGIRDPLLATAVAVSDGETTGILISVDVIGLCQDVCNVIREQIAAKCGVTREMVFIACTHTHLALPGTKLSDPHYEEILLPVIRKIVGLAQMAIEDMKPAEMRVNKGETPVDISFVRRRKKKDGELAHNADEKRNAEADGEPDKRVALTYFIRENAPEIAIINFQVHPDVVGGLKLSADYPGFVRRTYEAAVENSLCMYINGCQGDTNHINVRTPDGELKGGYEFARHMGHTIAGTAMALRAMAQKVPGVPVRGVQKNIGAVVNKAGEREVQEARRLVQLYNQGHYEELTTEEGNFDIMKLAVALRIAEAADRADMEELYVTGLSFGEFAIVGFPGEPFTDIGREVKNASQFRMTYAACCANGYEGYFPNERCYRDGGYEVLTARFRECTAGKLISAGIDVLKTLRGEEN